MLVSYDNTIRSIQTRPTRPLDPTRHPHHVCQKLLKNSELDGVPPFPPSLLGKPLTHFRIGVDSYHVEQSLASVKFPSTVQINTDIYFECKDNDRGDINIIYDLA